MNRLTRRTKEGKALLKDDTIYLSDVIKKCAEYEDLEEQGLLLRLPCKVGDTVWEICRSLTFGEVGDKAEVWYRIEHREFTLSMRGYFGKTVFLTRTEAEQALERMEKENEMQ
jgi:hypothetical protein